MNDAGSTQLESLVSNQWNPKRTARQLTRRSDGTSFATGLAKGILQVQHLKLSLCMATTRILIRSTAKYKRLKDGNTFMHLHVEKLRQPPVFAFKMLLGE
jgi:hypothetical protein